MLLKILLVKHHEVYDRVELLIFRFISLFFFWTNVVIKIVANFLLANDDAAGGDGFALEFDYKKSIKLEWFMVHADPIKLFFVFVEDVINKITHALKISKLCTALLSF